MRRFLMFVFMGVCWAGAARADVPGTVGYNGVLLTCPESGPCNGYSYQGPVTFRLWDDPASTDPAHLVWEETQDGCGERAPFGLPDPILRGQNRLDGRLGHGGFGPLSGQGPDKTTACRSPQVSKKCECMAPGGPHRGRRVASKPGGPADDDTPVYHGV